MVLCRGKIGLCFVPRWIRRDFPFVVAFAVAIPIFIARGLKDRKDGGVKSPAERLLRKAEDEAVLALLNQKRAERGEETMLKSLPSQQENQVDDESLREQFYIWLEKFIKADTEDTCITDNDKRLLPPSRYVAAYRNYLKNLR